MKRKVVRINENAQTKLEQIKNEFKMGCGINVKDGQIIETALKMYFEAIREKRLDKNQCEINL